jgi:L-iditol 2-dehydrogenase
MKAVVYYGKNDVRVEEVPVPACGAGELRVRIEACAVCGSDLKTFQNGNPRMKPPITMGHEFSGRLDTVGAGVRGFAAGERVVMATSVSCGQCFYCRKGWSNLCANLKPMGFAFPGGMAEYLIVPELAVRNGHVVKVPDPPGGARLASEHAALAEPVSCAVNCAELCGITEGDTVVVVGAGPLGLMNLFVAREFGARKLILAQRAGKRLEQARAFDCGRLVNSSEEDLRAVVLEQTGGLGADCVIVAAPSADAQAQAVGLLRKRGTLCLFASLPVGTHLLSLDSRAVHYGELRVVGASDSTARHVEKALALLAKPGFPKEKLVSHRLGLEDIARAFEMMTARDCLRVVLRP